MDTGWQKVEVVPAPPPGELYPDARTDTHVRCRVCGKWVRRYRSRMFWTGDGVIRTCERGDDPHTWKEVPR